MSYVGRFAPSPTGPLHAGSLVAALASWLDARAHGGRWLVRIEDVDTPRSVSGADTVILDQLASLGLLPDAPPEWQSRRSVHYEVALDTLRRQGLAYSCVCSRSTIAAHWRALGVVRGRHEEWPYPGTCRDRPPASIAAPAAWRVRTDGARITWCDRRLGPQWQDVESAVGDIVVRRSDGLWAYQLAVVVDDGAQGVTHIVRGEDLADNTARQHHLQRMLGLPAPHYLHTPLVLGADGEKLSKQHGAPPIDSNAPRAALQAAAAHLLLPVIEARGVGEWLALAVSAWPGACKRMRIAPEQWGAELPAKADTMPASPPET